MPKPLKITLAVVLGLLLLCTIGLFVAGNIVYNIALRPDTDKTLILDFALSTMELERERPDMQPHVQEWYDTRHPEELTVESFDGLALYGLLVPHEEGPTHKWMIACHGYMGVGRQMMAAALKGTGWGYHVLLPDARACGQSEGDAIGMGWYDRLDVLRWVDYIIERDPEAEIVLYGMSMGGAMVLMAAGENPPPNVKAVVSDCSYASVNEEFRYQLKEILGLPGFPLIPICSLICKLRAGFFLGDCDTVRQVEKATVPILYFHGEDDTFVPYYMMELLYEATPTEKEKLSVPGAGHGMSSAVDSPAYWSTMEQFLAKHVP